MLQCFCSFFLLFSEMHSKEFRYYNHRANVSPMHTVQNRVLTQKAIWLLAGTLFYEKGVSQEPVVSSALLSVQNGPAREKKKKSPLPEQVLARHLRPSSMETLCGLLSVQQNGGYVPRFLHSKH